MLRLPSPAFHGLLLDKAGALTAIAWFSLSISKSIEFAASAWASNANSVIGLAHVANIVLLSAIIFFLIRRRAASSKARGALPRLAALGGLLAPIAFALIPSQAPEGASIWIGAALMLIGTLGAIWAVFHLGRSFSILPQARSLVTSGPYRFVRHPLYVAELVAVAGLMTGFAQPWATIVYLLSICAQIPRIIWEERVLASAFPHYAAYAARTARFIPFVY